MSQDAQCNRIINFNTIIIAVLLVFGFGWSSQSICAQPVLPADLSIPQIDPGRISEGIEKTKKREVRLQAELLVDEELSKKTASSKELVFRLRYLGVKGMTAFTRQQLEPLYVTYIGKNVTLSDLKTIATAITVKYRKAGFMATRAIVPAQRVRAGKVYIQVIEGYVSAVIIEGKLNNSGRRALEGYGNRVKAYKPIMMKTLERYVLLANDLPGITVKAILKPSKEHLGGSDLVFMVDQKRYNAVVSFDNNGTRYLGPLQLIANLSVNSLLGTADELTAVAMRTTDSDVKYYQLIYNRLLNADGLKLELSGNYTTTSPGYSLESLHIKGESKSYYADLIYPVVRARGNNISIHGKVRVLNTESDYDGGLLFKDRLRTLQIGGRYENRDRLNGINIVTIDATKGLPIMDASKRYETAEEPPTSRIGGCSDFEKVNLSVARLQPLGKRFSVLAMVQGQYAWEPLLSAEEIGFGGTRFGRGYDGSAFVGDTGIVGSLQLTMYTHTGLAFWRGADYYIFYDFGVVWNKGALSDQPQRMNGASAGGGLRIDFTSHLQGNFYAAAPLTNRDMSDAGHKRDARIFFNVSAAI